MEKGKMKHPGEVLLTEITKAQMSQKELALRTGVSEKHISTIINGGKDISASFARKLEIALGSEKNYWAQLQAEYDQYQVQLEEENNITDEEIEILSSMKEIVDYFISEKIMHNNCGDASKVLQLRDVLRVSNLTVIPKITYNAAYRAQLKTSTSINQYTLFAWQRLCEIKTEHLSCNPPFSAEKLKQRIDDIKKVMFEQNVTSMLNKLTLILSECGIAFHVVRHFRGAPVQGFIKEKEDESAILCLTIRMKKADIFWFSLFHEIGHLLNGDLSVRFVDFDSVKSAMEEQADIFARDTLIPMDLYNAFVSKRDYSLSAIKHFAQEVGVPHWIVIGRLHSDEWLDWNIFAHETPSFEWA